MLGWLNPEPAFPTRKPSESRRASMFGWVAPPTDQLSGIDWRSRYLARIAGVSVESNEKRRTRNWRGSAEEAASAFFSWATFWIQAVRQRVKIGRTISGYPANSDKLCAAVVSSVQWIRASARPRCGST